MLEHLAGAFVVWANPLIDAPVLLLQFDSRRKAKLVKGNKINIINYIRDKYAGFLEVPLAAQ